jgi:hypothetical protein
MLYPGSVEASMAESIQIQCPNGHLLALEVKYVGKHVQCPMCQMLMVVPASSVPAAPPFQQDRVTPQHFVRQEFEDKDEDDEEEEAEERWDYGESPRKVRLGLEKIRVGLNYHIAKIYVFVVGIILLIVVSGFALGAGVNPRALGLLVFIGLVVVIMYVTGLVLDILTFIHLAACPEKTEARPLAIAYITLESVGAVLQFASELVGRDNPGHNLLQGISALVGLGGYICLIVLLKRLAIFIRRKKLVGSATGLLILLGLTGFFTVLFVLGAAIADPHGPGDASVVLILFGFVGMLITGIWSVLRYLRVIHKVRDAL